MRIVHPNAIRISDAKLRHNPARRTSLRRSRHAAPQLRAIRAEHPIHHSAPHRKCRNEPNPSHRPAQKIERITKQTHRGRAPRQWRKRANEFFPDTRSQVRPARRAIRTHFANHHAIRARKCRNEPNPSHRPARKTERITKQTHRSRAPRQWRKRANEPCPDTRSQVRPARRAIRTHFAKHHAIRTRKCRNKPNPSHRPAQKIERITKQTHRRPRHPSRSRKRRNEPFRLPQPLRHGSPKA